MSSHCTILHTSRVRQRGIKSKQMLTSRTLPDVGTATQKSLSWGGRSVANVSALNV